MIVLAIIVIVLVIILFILAGIEATIGSVATGGVAEDENPNIQQAHVFLALAASLTWISVGFVIIALILAVVLGAIGLVVAAPELSLESVTAGISDLSKTFQAHQQKAHNGFMGVQAINEAHGFAGGLFKLVFFGMLLLVAGVAILSTLAVFQLLQSDEKPGLNNALIAAGLAITPFIAIIVLEIVNYFYVKNERKQAQAQKQQIVDFEKQIIREQVANHHAATAHTPPPVAVATSHI